jgi:hypothetical protein
VRAGTRSSSVIALVRAFCPGEAATLRECRETDWQSLTFSGKRIVIHYDLADEATRRRAFTLAQGCDQFDVGLPRATLVEVEATVRGDRLTVEALVIDDDERSPSFRAGDR